MSSLNTSIKEKTSGASAAKKLQPKASVTMTAAPKIAMRQRIYQRVPSATIGGFKVFGSPVQPTHRTKLQIAEAVAKLD